VAPEQLPIERGNRLPPHLKLPKPHGAKWQKLKLRLKQDTSTNIKHQLQQQKHSFRATGQLTFNDEPTKTTESTDHVHLKNSLEQPRRRSRGRGRAIQMSPNGSP
jgi:hypothetical protein